ncbi:hypothetical protein QIH85_24110 [Bradyrhizobium japonicum]|uniref:hypothetical protein n=1 Tax=Bradyrhizobium japonicum TaxID=375 RepID=UPI0027154969|nr:hypothetical protein [Bradyrhizobium japonicum]WLB24969.1 hypothetical protein QIH85_24110 [Bradyrhizobium japonicum]
MAYLDEQALLRSVNRQRMLSGQNPVSSLAELVGGPPGKVRVSETEPLKVPLMQGPGPQVQQLTTPQDNSLAQAIGGILGGGGGGLQQMLNRMNAMRNQRAVPTPNVTRGPDLPVPRDALPHAPATPPTRATEAIPGLQPPLNPNARAPGDAAQSYYRERAPGPAVRGVPKPPEPQASPGQSGILARQRAPYAAQMEANPAVKEKMMALMVAEEGGDRDARTALAESAYNRGASRNMQSIDQVLDPRYYQPMHDGSGSYERALQRIRTDPKLRAEVEQDLSRATGGSNVSKLATDNASAGVARNSMTNQTHTHTTANGESWFRKDVRPDVHGALAVKQTKDWHDNTTAAMVDEKPEPPAGDKPVDARWAPEQVAAQQVLSEAAGKPAAFPDVAPAQAAPQPEAAPESPQLTPEALKARGEQMLAERPELAPQKPLAMTPEIGKAAISATQPDAPKRSDTLKSALWSATRTDQLPVPAPKPDLPAPATAPAPPVLAQGADETPQPAQAPPTLPAGNAPRPIIDAAVTGRAPPQLSPIPQVQTSWEPPPQVQQTQLGLNMQPFGQGNLSPIPWDWMGGWGWGQPAGFDTGAGWGGSFDTGFSGFDFFGGGNMGGW